MFNCYAPFYEATGQSVPQMGDIFSESNEFDNVDSVVEDAYTNYQSNLCR